MHILVTGAAGRIGVHTLSHLLEGGHRVLAVDVVPLPASLPATPGGSAPPALPHPRLAFRQGDLCDVSFVDSVFGGDDDDGTPPFDGVIHLGAIPNPRADLDDRVLHATNAVSSYNVLRTAVDAGVRRVVQASSVNAHGLSYAPPGHTRFAAFPLAEDAPMRPEDAYATSKAECELQADALCRWAGDAGAPGSPAVRIASLRFHMVRDTYAAAWPDCTARDVFSWVSYESCARACALALTAARGAWAGHEVFNIVAPETCWEGSVERQRCPGEPQGERAHTADLLARYWPDARLDTAYLAANPRAAAWTSAKAQRVLGWSHEPPQVLQPPQPLQEQS